MSSPQDSRARRRQKRRRAKKNEAWIQKRAEENAAADEPRVPPKTAT
jgi:hypothetical protein